MSSVARAFRGPRGRRISGSVEHTAPLAPGSSGSPLVDGEGRLLGLNTNRLGGGFYLALPADEALRGRVAALQRGESAERPRLGIGIAPSWVALRMRRAVGLPDREGVLVREVEPDSPAARAGISEGDLIVEAGGRPITEPDDVYDALGGGQRRLDTRAAAGARRRRANRRRRPSPRRRVRYGGESDGPFTDAHAGSLTAGEDLERAEQLAVGDRSAALPDRDRAARRARSARRRPAAGPLRRA